MNRVKVTSTDIASIGYDPQSCVLEVEFNKGNRVYQYGDVPPTVHRELVGASSIGKYFSSAIKGKYPYHEVKGK